jgi:hypothetical protein
MFNFGLYHFFRSGNMPLDLTKKNVSGFCSKLTDDGRQVMAKAHIAFGKVS